MSNNTGFAGPDRGPQVSARPELIQRIPYNAAERSLHGIAIGRRNWTFCGSDAGGHRAAAIYTLIETAKLNDVDPQAWLADHPAKRIDELFPWRWKASRLATTLAQAA